MTLRTCKSVADGSVRALTRGNARRAKGSCRRQAFPRRDASRREGASSIPGRTTRRPRPASITGALGPVCSVLRRRPLAILCVLASLKLSDLMSVLRSRRSSMGRASASAVATVATLGLAALHGCFLINTDAFDPVGDAGGGGGSPDAWVGIAVRVDAAADGTADDSSTQREADTVSQSGSSVTDAHQGGDVLDVIASSGEAGRVSGSPSGSASGGSGSGTASGGTSGSTGESSSGTASGATSGSSSGSASGSASGAKSGLDAGDGHPCGADVLTPQMAVASSVQGGDIVVPASQAIDGNFATRWGSVYDIDPSWIYMDLGQEVFVGEVDILWENACGANYDIDVSEDASTWVVVKRVVGNDVGGSLATKQVHVEAGS
jgi:F5/8 type C domain